MLVIRGYRLRPLSNTRNQRTSDHELLQLITTGCRAAGWIFNGGWIGIRCLGLGYCFEPEQKNQMEYGRERRLRGNGNAKLLAVAEMRAQQPRLV